MNLYLAIKITINYLKDIIFGFKGKKIAYVHIFKISNVTCEYKIKILQYYEIVNKITVPNNKFIVHFAFQHFLPNKVKCLICLSSKERYVRTVNVIKAFKLILHTQA